MQCIQAPSAADDSLSPTVHHELSTFFFTFASSHTIYIVFNLFTVSILRCWPRNLDKYFISLFSLFLSFFLFIKIYTYIFFVVLLPRYILSRFLRIHHENLFWVVCIMCNLCFVSERKQKYTNWKRYSFGIVCDVQESICSLFQLCQFQLHGKHVTLNTFSHSSAQRKKYKMEKSTQLTRYFHFEWIWW